MVADGATASGSLLLSGSGSSSGSLASGGSGPRLSAPGEVWLVQLTRRKAATRDVLLQVAQDLLLHTRGEERLRRGGGKVEVEVKLLHVITAIPTPPAGVLVPASLLHESVVARHRERVLQQLLAPVLATREAQAVSASPHVEVGDTELDGFLSAVQRLGATRLYMPAAKFRLLRGAVMPEWVQRLPSSATLVLVSGSRMTRQAGGQDGGQAPSERQGSLECHVAAEECSESDVTDVSSSATWDGAHRVPPRATSSQGSSSPSTWDSSLPPHGSTFPGGSLLLPRGASPGSLPGTPPQQHGQSLRQQLAIQHARGGAAAAEGAESEARSSLRGGGEADVPIGACGRTNSSGSAAAQEEPLRGASLPGILSEEHLKPRGGSCECFPISLLQEATGNWAEENKIGSGAGGVVYRGRDPRSGALWAVKRSVQLSHQVEQSASKAFVREVEAIAALHHPHLLRLLGFCLEVDRDRNLMESIVVYEFAPQGDLASRLRRDPPLPLPERLAVLLGVARGLDHLHLFGIVHRDVKASNVLLGEGGQALLADFGTVRMTDGGQTRVVGTPGLVDPAYSRTGIADYSADVYSFGLLALELLAMRSRKARTEPQIRDWVEPHVEAGNVAACSDPALSSCSDDVILRIARLALRCTAMPVSSRPRTADIIAQLEAIQASMTGHRSMGSMASLIDIRIQEQSTAPSLAMELQMMRERSDWTEAEGGEGEGEGGTPNDTAPCLGATSTGDSSQEAGSAGLLRPGVVYGSSGVVRLEPQSQESAAPESPPQHSLLQLTEAEVLLATNNFDAALRLNCLGPPRNRGRLYAGRLPLATLLPPQRLNQYPELADLLCHGEGGAPLEDGTVPVSVLLLDGQRSFLDAPEAADLLAPQQALAACPSLLPYVAWCAAPPCLVGPALPPPPRTLQVALVVGVGEGHKPLLWRERLDALADVARALQALHSLSPPLLHLNVHPGSVFLPAAPSLHARLAHVALPRIAQALGPAASNDHELLSKTLPGAASFLDPHLAHGHSATTASDVFSFGALVADVLFNARAETGIVQRLGSLELEGSGEWDEHQESAASQVMEQLDPLAEWPVQVAVQLVSLAAACLAPDPDARPTTAQMVASLAEVVDVADEELLEEDLKGVLDRRYGVLLWE